ISNIGLSTTRFNAGPPVRVTVTSREPTDRSRGTSEDTGTSNRSDRNPTTNDVASGCSITASPHPTPPGSCRPGRSQPHEPGCPQPPARSVRPYPHGQRCSRPDDSDPAEPP